MINRSIFFQQLSLKRKTGAVPHAISDIRQMICFWIERHILLVSIHERAQCFTFNLKNNQGTIHFFHHRRRFKANYTRLTNKYWPKMFSCVALFFYYLFTGCFICFHPVITKYGQEITALFLRAHLCGLGYPRQPFPRVTLAELNLLLFLWKLHLTVYMRIANLSRGPDISGGRVVSLRQVG